MGKNEASREALVALGATHEAILKALTAVARKHNAVNRPESRR